MLTFSYAPTPPPRAAPAARPRRTPKVNRLPRTLKLNSTNWLFSNLSPRFRSWRHSHPPVIFTIWGFHFDISEWHIRSARAWTPTLMLHLTNRCAKRKVLSLTKPKGKIYKTKSLGYYITNLSARLDDDDDDDKILSNSITWVNQKFCNILVVRVAQFTCSGYFCRDRECVELTGLSGVEFAWFSPSGTYRICFNGLEHGLGIHFFLANLTLPDRQGSSNPSEISRTIIKNVFWLLRPRYGSARAPKA